jgi:hypothetical protein
MIDAGMNERARRRAVAACQVFFLLIILEGVLRKWLLNPIQQPLVLVRDPVLIFIYLQYCFYRRWALPSWVMGFGLALALLLALILLQASYLDLSASVYLIGLRNYIAFAPLAFIIGEIYDRQDLDNFIKMNLYMCVPIGLLVAAQFFSPVDSLLNKSPDNGVEGIFVVAEGVVRPYGPFTFTVGQAAYGAMAVAIGLIALERRAWLGLSWPALMISLGAIGTMGVLSGTRTYFLSAGMVFLAYALSSATGAGNAAAFKRGAYAVIAVLGMVLLMTVVFPRAYETMSERQADAVAVEGSTLGRAVSMLTEVSDAMTDTPLFGLGVGYGTNAGSYASAGVRGFSLAEYEWKRLVQECGPLFGFIVIGIRIALAVWASVLALEANIRRNDAAAMIMLGFVGPLFFVGQISGQNTMLSFAWFGLGLVVALSRAREIAAPASSPDARPLARDFLQESRL